MKKKKTFVGVALLVAVLMLGVGYAAIKNITLNVNGSLTASPNDDNFIVKLTGTPAVSDGDLVEAEVTGDRTGTIEVTGLTAKGEFVTATYTVANTSPDLKAGITASATWDNKTYFNVTTTVKDAEIAALTGTTTVEVKVELVKTPVEADVVDETINVAIVAAPVQQ